MYSSIDAISEGLSEIEGKLSCASKISLGLSKETSPVTVTPVAAELGRSNGDMLSAIEQDAARKSDSIDEFTRDVASTVELADKVTREFHDIAEECVELMQENDRLRKVVEVLGRKQIEELTQMCAETDEAKAVLQEHLSQAPVPQIPSFYTLLAETLPLIRQALLSLDARIETDWSVSHPQNKV